MSHMNKPKTSEEWEKWTEENARKYASNWPKSSPRCAYLCGSNDMLPEILERERRIENLQAELQQYVCSAGQGQIEIDAITAENKKLSDELRIAADLIDPRVKEKFASLTAQLKEMNQKFDDVYDSWQKSMAMLKIAKDTLIWFQVYADETVLAHHNGPEVKKSIKAKQALTAIDELEKNG